MPDPCWRCGSVPTCKHRVAPPPVVLADPKPTPINCGGGRYKLGRGAYSGLAARIARTGTPKKLRKDT
jgi:hypothetical protein